MRQAHQIAGRGSRTASWSSELGGANPAFGVRAPRSAIRVRMACLLLAAFALLLASGCRRRAGDAFVLALEASPKSIHPLMGSDAASERFRQLMYNTLMKKNERLDYVPDLASDVRAAPDGMSVTFTLREGVKFHDGKALTSADVKYTFDKLLAPNSPSPKSPSFFEGTGDARQPFITAVEAPDPRTVVFRLRKAWLELYSNMIPIGIIPEGSFETLDQKPNGTGPYKFVARNEAQQSVDLAAFDEYWEGAPNIKQVRVRVILDAGTQQAELQAGSVHFASNTALTPDTYDSLARNPNLTLHQSPGANIQYLGMNTEAAPLNDPRVRRAVAHAIDREQLVKQLLLGQARIAHSMIPPESWSYSEGQKYNYDPEQAKRLLDEAGLRDPDGDGPRARFAKPLVFKISATNAVGRRSSEVIQNMLAKVGIPASIEPLEDNTLREQLVNGQYHLTTGRWVGGNQDPIFLRDLFTFLTGKGNYRFNRSRYSNPELDKILGEAVNTADRTRARELYAQAQEIISREVPTLPLWYPNNIAVANKGVGNVNVDPSADWKFVRTLTFTK